MKRLSELTLISILFALAGCGLGTEVGNGFKSDGGDDGKNAKKASGSQQDQAPADDSQATNSPAPEANEDKGVEGGVSDGTDGAENSTDGIRDGADTPPETPEGFDFNPALLVASCASPFAEDYGTNYLIETADAGQGIRNRLAASRDGAEGPWDIKAHDGAHMFSVEKNAAGGAVAVKTKDSSDKVVDYFTCTAVSTKTNVDVEDLAFKVTKRSVYIGNSRLKALVTWFFRPADGQTKAELVRIEVDDVDGENDAVRLDVSPDSVP